MGPAGIDPWDVGGAGAEAAHSAPGGTLACPLEGMDPAKPRIGPRAVLQTLRALDELEAQHRAEVEARAVVEPLGEGMIPERVFVGLIRAVREVLPRDRAE